jgi:hypothetical protein
MSLYSSTSPASPHSRSGKRSADISIVEELSAQNTFDCMVSGQVHMKPQTKAGEDNALINRQKEGALWRRANDFDLEQSLGSWRSWVSHFWAFNSFGPN